MDSRFLPVLGVLAAVLASTLSCGTDRNASESASVEAWRELEALVAEMREVVVEEAETTLEVTDGMEYMLVSLRSAIDTSLNALEPSETLSHFGRDEPLVGCPNPDQDYWTAPLDPGGRYRIHGSLGGTVYLSMVIYGYVPEEEQLNKGWGSTLEAFLDSQAIELGPNGEIEVMVSATRPADARNWLPLTEHSREIMIREFHRDRETEVPASLAIERLDVPTRRTRTGADQLAGGRQMLRAAELADVQLDDAQVATWIRSVKANAEALLRFRHAQRIVDAAYGVLRANQPVVVTMEQAAARQAQPNPLVNYMNIRLDLEEGESLLIEGRPPESLYWVVQFCDRWMSAPGGHHTGWLNDGSVELEPDGRYRIVVGPTDPGTRNWIDTTSHRHGGLLWRFVSGENLPEPPTVERVRTSELK